MNKSPRGYLLCALVWLSLALSASSAAGAIRKMGVALDDDGPNSNSINKESEASAGVMTALAGVRPSRFAWFNHGTSALKTLQAIEQINKQKPELLVGMKDSFQSLLFAERLDPASFLITPLASSDEILQKSEKVLMLAMPNSVQAQLLTKEIKSRSKPGDRVLVVEVLADHNSQNLNLSLLKSLREAELPVESFKIHKSEMRNLSAVQMPESFQHIVLTVAGNEAARLIDSLAGKNSNAKYWGSASWGSDIKEIRGLSMAKDLRAIWLSHYHVAVSTEANAKFLEQYREKYKSDPTDVSAMYFEAAQLAIALGYSNAKPVADVIREVRVYKGLLGSVRISGKRVRRDIALLELKAGSPQFIKTVQEE